MANFVFLIFCYEIVVLLSCFIPGLNNNLLMLFYSFQHYLSIFMAWYSLFTLSWISFVYISYFVFRYTLYLVICRFLTSDITCIVFHCTTSFSYLVELTDCVSLTTMLVQPFFFYFILNWWSEQSTVMIWLRQLIWNSKAYVFAKLIYFLKFSKAQCLAEMFTYILLCT